MDNKTTGITAMKEKAEHIESMLHLKAHDPSVRQDGGERSSVQLRHLPPKKKPMVENTSEEIERFWNEKLKRSGMVFDLPNSEQAIEPELLFQEQQQEDAAVDQQDTLDNKVSSDICVDDLFVEEEIADDALDDLACDIVDDSLDVAIEEEKVVFESESDPSNKKIYTNDTIPYQHRPVIHLEPVQVNWVKWSASEGILDSTLDVQEKKESTMPFEEVPFESVKSELDEQGAQEEIQIREAILAKEDSSPYLSALAEHSDEKTSVIETVFDECIEVNQDQAFSEDQLQQSDFEEIILMEDQALQEELQDMSSLPNDHDVDMSGTIIVEKEIVVETEIEPLFQDQILFEEAEDPYFEEHESDEQEIELFNPEDIIDDEGSSNEFLDEPLSEACEKELDSFNEITEEAQEECDQFEQAEIVNEFLCSESSFADEKDGDMDDSMIKVSPDDVFEEIDETEIFSQSEDSESEMVLDGQDTINISHKIDSPEFEDLNNLEEDFQEEDLIFEDALLTEECESEPIGNEEVTNDRFPEVFDAAIQDDSSDGVEVISQDDSSEEVEAISQDDSSEEVEAISQDNSSDGVEVISQVDFFDVFEEVPDEDFAKIVEEASNEDLTNVAEEASNEDLTNVTEEASSEDLPKVVEEVLNDDLTKVDDEISNEDLPKVDDEVSNDPLSEAFEEIFKEHSNIFEDLSLESSPEPFDFEISPSVVEHTKDIFDEINYPLMKNDPLTDLSHTSNYENSFEAISADVQNPSLSFKADPFLLEDDDFSKLDVRQMAVMDAFFEISQQEDEIPSVFSRITSNRFSTSSDVRSKNEAKRNEEGLLVSDVIIEDDPFESEEIVESDSFQFRDLTDSNEGLFDQDVIVEDDLFESEEIFEDDSFEFEDILAENSEKALAHSNGAPSLKEKKSAVQKSRTMWNPPMRRKN